MDNLEYMATQLSVRLQILEGLQKIEATRALYEHEEAVMEDVTAEIASLCTAIGVEKARIAETTNPE